ncbi:MAG: UPF0149 family protein [Chlorobiaceae bacterium]|nr:UPF0149 family protein [Chlorobiaceae bacterium]NTW11570.1 UPF0149 family protein [Chlorobiaceae bacterium]
MNFETNQGPLSEEELLELEELLVSAGLPSGAMTLDALDGFLTSLAIGPVRVGAEEWMPVVLGNEKNTLSDDLPEATVQRLVSLVLRYENTIAVIFRDDPDTFRPLFELSAYACAEDEESAVQAWSHAFMNGIEMRYDEWAPLIEMAELTDEEGERSAMLLGPVLLLSGRDSRSPGLTSEQREQLGMMVAESISDIYRFWLPFRDLFTGEP